VDRVLFTGKPWTERCSPAQSGALSGSAPTLSVGVLPGASRPKTVFHDGDEERPISHAPRLTAPHGSKRPVARRHRSSKSRPGSVHGPGILRHTLKRAAACFPSWVPEGFFVGSVDPGLPRFGTSLPNSLPPERSLDIEDLGRPLSPSLVLDAGVPHAGYIYIYIYIYAFWARRLLLDVAAPGFEVV